MRKIIAIVKKELRSSFNSPIAYGVVLFFLIFSAIWLFFIQRFFAMDSASLRPYFAVFPIAFTLVVPALTMRSWAEERKLGTAELLLTMPFSETEMVIGKFLSSYAVLSLALVLTLPLPIMMTALGDFDSGAILGEYIGAFLLGAAAISIGLLTSSLAKNQVSAFLSALMVLLVITMANQMTQIFNLPSQLADVINYLSLAFHFESFSKGVIDTRDLLYFLFISALCLYANQRVILFRKWS